MANIEFEMPSPIERCDIRPAYMEVKHSIEDKKLNIELEKACNISVEIDEEQIPLFAVLKCGKIGKNLGNQQFEPAEDTSCYHSLYENIMYKDIHSADV